MIKIDRGCSAERRILANKRKIRRTKPYTGRIVNIRKTKKKPEEEL